MLRLRTWSAKVTDVVALALGTRSFQAAGMAGWQFWIDRGGTFTDIVARAPDGSLATAKLLSHNPARYRDAALAGIRQVLGLGPDPPIAGGTIDAVKMGTTIATNALLERRGARTLLLVNRGFADLPRIGHQARPDLFALDIVLPQPLHERVVEVAGRVAADGAVLEPLDEPALRTVLANALADGLQSCAIALIHAWAYPAQEARIAELAGEAGFTQVSASHAVSPLLRLVPRADTAVVDAYLSPVLRRHVDDLATSLGDTRLFMMQSHGGLTDAQAFSGKDAILSGPAGGIVGAARTAAMAGIDHVIGFDMGGTSTDVALYAGTLERSLETEIAGIRLRVPMLAINTIAAGGGSVLHAGDGRFRVGPDSAGANPGPACYRNGGPLTVTDANMCVGKIQPAHFPAIFGPGGDQPPDLAVVRAGFAALAEALAQTTGDQHDPRDIAEGFLRIAVANMANAIAQVSTRKGHDPSDFTLQCFGGAGGQHACLVADALGMSRVFLHPLAGVLSAYGMGLADRTVLRQQAVEMPLDDAILPELSERADRLVADAVHALRDQGADQGAVATIRTLHLRLAGTDTALEVPFGRVDELRAAFATLHLRRYGFAAPDRPLVVEAIAVEATLPGEAVREPPAAAAVHAAPCPIETVEMWSGGCAHQAGLFDRAALYPGHDLHGPALICEPIGTIVVEPGWQLEVTPQNHILLHRARAAIVPATVRTDRPDPVLLELFNARFMHAAEQAGHVLQNIAQSVNIKERLDFSCAIFDAEGGLVANAPHVPVHLGAMGESVRTVLRDRAGTLRQGDVVALNDPYAGGTHLPDITVITPVFSPDGADIRFFVGARGHHADIGGTTPGSTPPNSRTLEDEGVVIRDFLLVDQGRFREAAFRDLLAAARYPARSPDMNVADIQAQVASNAACVRELSRIVAEHGWGMVRAYMRHVMDHAEESVRRALARVGDGRVETTLDSGARLCVAITVDHEARSATIDFSGTGPQSPDNFNAPPAVTRAVVLYVMRCLVGTDIPLNEGCLKPLTIVIPPGTFLSPAPGAPVVAGNTEISQAVCNALFAALGLLAGSQGTMNNLLFGDATRQYYETICGGAGAGPGFDGQSAVQTHMTNTRMTDPEVLELRYPIRVEQFSIDRGSGGKGRHHGGDGVVRRLRFLEPMTAVIVASSRIIAPRGLEGGADGRLGRQWVERAAGGTHVLPGTTRIDMLPGDVLGIATPGGGGYGVQRHSDRKPA